MPADHLFVDDPNVPGICAVAGCEMPRPNRVHVAPATTTLAPLSESVARLRFNGRTTSHRAALASLPKSTTVKGQVLAVIARASLDHGVTDAELGHRLMQVKANTLRPRRIDLVMEGWVEPVRDENGADLTRGGFTCWRLTDAARVTLAESAA